MNNTFTYEDSSLDEANIFVNTKDALIKHKDKAKIVIMGLKKSGKSSISKVVFHKLSPNEVSSLPMSPLNAKGLTRVQTLHLKDWLE